METDMCQNYTYTASLADSQEQQQNTSQYLTLLYTLGLGGGLVSIIYFILELVRDQLKKQFISSITLESGDQVFKYMHDFLLEKKLMINISNLSLASQLVGTQQQTWWRTKDDDIKKTQLQYRPDNGAHKFRYKGNTIFVRQFEGQTMTVGHERKPQKPQTLCLWMVGSKKIHYLQELVQDALQHAIQKDSGKIKIYAMHQWFPEWQQVQSKEPINIDNVILDQHLSNQIVQDMISFRSNKDWYKQTGVPYRRGYLLYGPPGTGKTSTILAVASKLQLNLCTVNLSGNRLDDDDFNKLLESTPRDSIVLLEDVDAIFVDRMSAKKKSKGRSVSFSGLLNAIDGVRTTDGRILFMTTNHKEKLDPALLRPGRADVHVYLDYASHSQIERLFLKFYPGQTQQSKEFSKIIPEKTFSMAKLQGHFVKYKDDQENLFKNIEELKEIKLVQQDMQIIDWLSRFNLEHLAFQFKKENLFTIQDLQSIENDKLEKFGVNSIGQKQNMLGVLNGEKQFIDQFLLLSQNSLRIFFMNQLQMKKNDQLIQDILSIVPEKSVCQFQLKQILASKNYSTKTLKQDLKNLVQKNKRLENDEPYRQKLLENQEDLPYELDLQKLLKEQNLEEYSEIFQNQHIDTEIFLSLTQQDLEKLEIKNFGHSKTILKLIEKFNKHKKEQQNEHQLSLYTTNEKNTKLLSENTSLDPSTYLKQISNISTDGEDDNDNMDTEPDSRKLSD